MVTPISKQLQNLSAPKTFYVTQRYSVYTVVSHQSPDLLGVGERVSLSDGQYGVVVSIEDDQATIRSPLPTTAEYAHRATGLLYQSPITFKLYTDAANVGKLTVYCRSTKTMKSGLLGWDLLYNDTLIAQGSDYSNKDICFIESSGIWPVGNYTIRVTSYLDPVQPLRRGLRKVLLTSPSSTLEVGGRSDKLGPLFLS